MGFQFLSDEWFTEVERIRAEINPAVPDVIKDVVINIRVAGGPDGDVEAKMIGGRVEKGLAGDAPTTITIPYDVAKKMIIEGDQTATIQAFLSGIIQVDGDMATIMGMQAAGAPSPESERVRELVKAITE